MNMEGLSYSLSVRVERPIADCELSAYPYLVLKGGALDNQARSKLMDANPHTFVYKWCRGPKRPICCYKSCPRGSSFDPTKWSRAACGGTSILCAVCDRAKVSRYEATFCSVSCFMDAWKTHSTEKHTQLKFTPTDVEQTTQELEKMEIESENVTDISSVQNEHGNQINVTQTVSTSVNPSANNNNSNYNNNNSGIVDSDLDGQEWTMVSSEKVYVPTQQDIGCVLRLVVQAVATNGGKVLAGPVTTYTEPVLAAPKPPPKRQLVTVSGALTGATAIARFRVISYNILAELYATKQAYPYCDTWSLSWPYRRKMILQELVDSQGDIICLQEVQSDHYEQHINPFMQELGYDGLFKQKARESMGQYGKVDGCATFWRRNKFIMTENYTIDFNESARRQAGGMGLDELECRRYFNRLHKDNIAQVVFLEVQIPRTQTSMRGVRTQICVANTHLYSNHQRPDVKLWQTMTLVSELEQLTVPRDVPLLICGDFNSEPDSAVYEYLADGVLDRPHPEVEESDNLHILPELHTMAHNLSLQSAMKTALGSESAFTNYTALFKGTLDYIWFTPSRLRVLAVNAMPDEKDMVHDGEEGLPSTSYPSDHIMLVSDMALTSSGGITRSVSSGAGLNNGAMSRGMGGMMNSNMMSSNNMPPMLMRSKSSSNVVGNASSGRMHPMGR